MKKMMSEQLPLGKVDPRSGLGCGLGSALGLGLGEILLERKKDIL